MLSQMLWSQQNEWSQYSDGTVLHILIPTLTIMVKWSSCAHMVTMCSDKTLNYDFTKLSH